MVDFILTRMNDFQRLCDLEPWNYTASEAVRLCSDLLYRLGYSVVHRSNGQWEIIKC